MLENFDEVYVANHEWKHLPEPFLTDFLNIRRNYEKALTELVETGIKKMEIKKMTGKSFSFLVPDLKEMKRYLPFAIIAGVLIALFSWNVADPLISIVIGVLIVWSSWHLMRDATNVLLEGTPAQLHRRRPAGDRHPAL